jgi:chromosome segregation ATPase
LTTGVKNRFGETKEHIDKLMDEVHTLRTNNSIRMHNIAAANRNNERLNANMMTCVDAIRETNQRNKQLEQQLLAMQQNVQQLQLSKCAT